MGPLRPSDVISHAPVTFAGSSAAKTFLVHINSTPQADADTKE
jgi:hypothetical protein